MHLVPFGVIALHWRVPGGTALSDVAGRACAGSAEPAALSRWTETVRRAHTGGKGPADGGLGWKKSGSNGKSVRIPSREAPPRRTTTCTTAAFCSQIT